jgi:hypothetical protein
MEQVWVKMAPLSRGCSSSRTRLLTCRALYGVEDPCVTVHVAIPSKPSRLDRPGEKAKPSTRAKSIIIRYLI